MYVGIVVCNPCHRLTQALHLATPLPPRHNFCPWEGAAFQSPGHALHAARVLMFWVNASYSGYWRWILLKLYGQKSCYYSVVQRRCELEEGCAEVTCGWREEGVTHTKEEIHWDLGLRIPLCMGFSSSCPCTFMLCQPPVRYGLCKSTLQRGPCTSSGI